MQIQQRHSGQAGRLAGLAGRSEEIIQRFLAILDHHEFVGNVALFEGSLGEFDIAGIVFNE
jgi:hypothetical protein